MVSTANECYGFPWLNILMKLHCLHLLWVNSQNWAGMDWDEWYKLFWSFSCKPSSSVKYHRITFDESKQLFWAWKDQIYILLMSRFLCSVCEGIKDLSRLPRLTGRRAVSCFEFLNEPWDCSQVKNTFSVRRWMFMLCFARRSPVFAQVDTTLYWPGDQRNSGGRTQEDESRKGQMDGRGWKRGLWGWNRRGTKRWQHRRRKRRAEKREELT